MNDALHIGQRNRKYAFFCRIMRNEFDISHEMAATVTFVFQIEIQVKLPPLHGATVGCVIIMYTFDMPIGPRL